MATGTIILNPTAAVLSDGAVNLTAALTRVRSGSASPVPHFYQLAFDATVTEQVTWQFVMPSTYASGPVLTVLFKGASDNSGGTAAVRWDARLGAVSPGDATNVNVKGTAAANLATTVLPATAGHLTQSVITLANADSVAAGDLVFLYLGRLGADAADTYTSDVQVVGAALSYTTT